MPAKSDKRAKDAAGAESETRLVPPMFPSQFDAKVSKEPVEKVLLMKSPLDSTKEGQRMFVSCRLTEDQQLFHLCWSGDRSG